MLTKTLFLHGIDGGRNISGEILAAGHEKEGKTRRVKGKMHTEICTAQLLCERGSFHTQHHLGPLLELE